MTTTKMQNRTGATKGKNVLAVVESENSIFDIQNPNSVANSAVYNGFADILASIDAQDKAV